MTTTRSGTRIVALRRVRVPFGPSWAITLWIVTDSHGRKALGERHATRALAAAWATAHGFVYTGTQEKEE